MNQQISSKSLAHVNECFPVRILVRLNQYQTHAPRERIGRVVTVFALIKKTRGHRTNNTTRVDVRLIALEDAEPQ